MKTRRQGDPAMVLGASKVILRSFIDDARNRPGIDAAQALVPETWIERIEGMNLASASVERRTGWRKPM